MPHRALPQSTKGTPWSAYRRASASQGLRKRKPRAGRGHRAWSMLSCTGQPSWHFHSEGPSAGPLKPGSRPGRGQGLDWNPARESLAPLRLRPKRRSRGAGCKRDLLEAGKGQGEGEGRTASLKGLRWPGAEPGLAVRIFTGVLGTTARASSTASEPCQSSTFGPPGTSDLHPRRAYGDPPGVKAPGYSGLLSGPFGPARRAGSLGSRLDTRTPYAERRAQIRSPRRFSSKCSL